MNYYHINTKFAKFKEYLTYLKNYQSRSLTEIKADHTLHGAVLHYLQLSIECALDLGEMLISQLKFRKPQESREVFLILAEEHILPEDFAKNFSKIAGLRNILVHEYADIDLEIIYQHLQNDLTDFDFYAQAVSKTIKKNLK